MVLENCYAMGNGYSDYGRGDPKNGNGYGIKMGQSTYGTGHHIIKQCVAWKNKMSGFYAKAPKLAEERNSSVFVARTRSPAKNRNSATEQISCGRARAAAIAP